MHYISNCTKDLRKNILYFKTWIGSKLNGLVKFNREIEQVRMHLGRIHMKFKTWLTKNKIFIVAVLSFIVAFSGLSLENILSYISPFLFPAPPDYKIASFDVPQTFDLNLPLSVLPKYFVIIHLGFKSQEISPDGEVRFSIGFENKGKTNVQQPRLILYFVDSLQQVRATWNQSLTEKEFTEGLVLKYSLPSADQKVMGSWKLIALLYDNGNPELISYVVQEFIVTETGVTTFLPVATALSLIAAISAISVAVMVLKKVYSK